MKAQATLLSLYGRSSLRLRSQASTTTASQCYDTVYRRAHEGVFAIEGLAPFNPPVTANREGMASDPLGAVHAVTIVATVFRNPSP